MARGFFSLQGAVLECAPVARPPAARSGFVAPPTVGRENQRRHASSASGLELCLTNGAGSLMLQCASSEQHAMWCAALHASIEQLRADEPKAVCSCRDSIVPLSAITTGLPRSWHVAHAHPPSRPMPPRARARPRTTRAGPNTFALDTSITL